MKVVIFLIACLAATACAEMPGERGFTDFIMNELGLAGVWNQITELGGNVVSQFISIGTQLLFAGQQIWEQAKVILNQLLADLTSHTGSASTIVAQAIAQLTQVLSSGAGKRGADQMRGIGDFILNTLGLSSVWDEIQSLGSGLMSQLMAIGTQLMFAGTQALNNAKPVLAQLVSDLTNHVGDASTIVAQAIATLTQTLANGKRDLTDFFLNTLGLGNVWSQIQSVGGNLLATLTAELTQLIFAGQQVLNNAKPVIQQLVNDLTNHFGDASTIVTQAIQSLAQVLANGNNGKRDLVDFFINTLGLGNVWSQIQSVGGNLLATLTAELTQLIFAGQQVLNQAKPILSQLINDLTNHFGDASTIVAQAVASLAQVLGKPF